MFDPVSYFQNLTNSLKLTKDKYKFSTVSGLNELEGILSNRKYHQFHVAVDVAETGALVEGGGRGFWNRRPNTVFICGATTDYNDMAKREEMMNEFRTIYKSFCTAIIKDDCQDGLLFINTNRIPYYEMPGEFAGGCVGLYFILTVDNQTDMKYNAADWE